ncbi:protein LSM14 homolog B [Polymixia lowei]
MSRGKPYIGCKIGLLSKAQNRYEGILYTIDTVNSTVVLAKVKCFGTEGRPTDRPTPPKDTIYEYITFRGSDIKDITLCEPPRSYHGLPQDPAILQSSIGSPSGLCSAQGPFSPLSMPSYNQLAASSLLNQQYAAALGLGPVLQGPLVRRGPMVEKAVQTVRAEISRQRRGVTAYQDQRWESRRPQGTRQDGFLTRRGTGPTSVSNDQQGISQEWGGIDENRQLPSRRQGARRRRNRSRGRLMAGNATSSTLKFETDFDFDSSNAQFIKEALEREMQDGLNMKEANSEGEEKEEQGDLQTEKDDLFGPKCYYNKAKSFFDNISSENKPGRTWAEERKRNLETFGVPGRFLRGHGFHGGYRERRGR